jgi:DNA repair protein RadC
MSIEYHLTIKEMPAEERPREKLEKFGAEALGNNELIAILLGHGFKNVSAIDLANYMLKEHSGLSGISRLGFTQLKQIKGMGLAKSAQLSAAFELARRLNLISREDRPVLKSPEDVSRVLLGRYCDKKKEHFGILILDSKNRLKKEEIISIGGLNANLIQPRELFHTALIELAAAVILFHNHPSGDPQPSQQDINLTKKMIEAGKLLGIDVLDHLVIGKNCFISLREKGLL